MITAGDTITNSEMKYMRFRPKAKRQELVAKIFGRFGELDKGTGGPDGIYRMQGMGRTVVKRLQVMPWATYCLRCEEYCVPAQKPCPTPHLRPGAAA